MKKEQTSWQFYRQRFIRILPPFLIFMILYCTLPVLWGQIDGETSLKDTSRIFLNFPSLAGHLWFMYPLISLYLFIPIISPWLSKATAKEDRFFIGLFLISTCMPYLNRWFGEVWGNVFGMNTICCGISQVTWDTSHWHITYVPVRGIPSNLRNTTTYGISQVTWDTSHWHITYVYTLHGNVLNTSL